MPQSVIAAAECAPAGPLVSASVSDVCLDLLELFTGVPDGRCGRGRDHPVAVVLALSAAAVVAGMKGYTAIAGWVADVPAVVREDLYARCGMAGAPAVPPSKTTIWRVVTDADPVAFDAAVGRWLMSLAGFTQRAGQAGAPGGDEETCPALMQVRLA